METQANHIIIDHDVEACDVVYEMTNGSLHLVNVM